MIDYLNNLTPERKRIIAREFIIFVTIGIVYIVGYIIFYYLYEHYSFKYDWYSKRAWNNPETDNRYLADSYSRRKQITWDFFKFAGWIPFLLAYPLRPLYKFLKWSIKTLRINETR